MDINGLFAPEPWQVRQQQNAGLNDAAHAYARLDPFQRANASLFNAGGMLGGAAAEGMGMTNSAVDQAEKSKDVISRGDLQTPEGLRALAKKMNDMGMTKQALVALKRADEIEKEKAKAAIDAREMKRKEFASLPELEKYAIAMARRSGLVEGSPEFDDFVSTWMYEQKEKAEKKDKTFKVGDTRSYQKGTEQITEEYQADGTWKQLGSGPKFQKLVEGVGGATPEDKLRIKNEAKLDMMYPKATVAVSAAEKEVDKFIRDLKELKTHPGLSGITGSVYGRTPSMSGDSINAQALYDTIMGKTFVSAINAMKQASAASGSKGTGLGSVTEREGEKVQAGEAALSRVQETANLQKKIELYIQDLENAKKNIRDAYDAEFEYRKGREKKPSGDSGEGKKPASVSNW